MERLVVGSKDLDRYGYDRGCLMFDDLLGG